MRDNPLIRDAAIQLYGLPAAQRFLEGLERLCRVQEPHMPRLPSRSLDEHDVLLITYPDQVTEAGLAPLASLGSFVDRHVHGLLNGMHILPFYPASSDDGFAVMDYREVDPSYGDWSEVTRLSERYRLMFDAVLNHASAEGEWFKAFLRDENPFNGYFLSVEEDVDLSAVVRPRTSPLLTTFATKRGDRAVWTTFSADQPDLDYRNPRVLLEMLDILVFYVRQGACFIRLDAVAYAWKDPDTTGIHRPNVHVMVRLMRAILAEIAPHVMLITETNVAHDENVTYLGTGANEAHLIYNFPLPPLILHTFQAGNACTLSDWAADLELPALGGTFFNVLATHDGIGLNGGRGILSEREMTEMVNRLRPAGAGISERSNPDGTAGPYEINANYLDALDASPALVDEELQVSRFLTAHAIMLSLKGMPGIYFHSMFGSRGWPEGVRRSGRLRAINRQKSQRVALERELSDPRSLRSRILRGMRHMLAMRRKSTAFSPDAGQEILHAGDGIFACARSGGENHEEVLCLHNVTPMQQEFECSAWKVGGRAVEDGELLDGSASVDFGSLNRWRLAPYESIWLRMKR